MLLKFSKDVWSSLISLFLSGLIKVKVRSCVLIVKLSSAFSFDIFSFQWSYGEGLRYLMSLWNLNLKREQVIEITFSLFKVWSLGFSCERENTTHCSLIFLIIKPSIINELKMTFDCIFLSEFWVHSNQVFISYFFISWLIPVTWLLPPQ